MLRPERSVQRHSAVPRLAEVEGLRAVAATSILIFHCWLFSSPATLRWNLGPFTAFVQPLQSGVTLFFVLSGFLLYRPIVRAVLSGGELPSTRAYLRHRVLRILPAYWVVLTATALVLGSAVTHGEGGGLASGALHDSRTLAADFSLTQTYDPRAVFTGILPAWSLTIEVAFYLSLPLLALLAWFAARRLRRNAIAVLTPAIALLIIGVLGKAVVAIASRGPERSAGTDWHTVLDRSFLTHADLFAFGMGAAVCLALYEGRAMPTLLARVTGRALAYVGMPTLILGYYVLPPYVYDSAVALGASLTLVRILWPRPVATRSVLTHRWTLAWGRVSYSVFLWNYPVLVFLGAHGMLATGDDAPAFIFNLALAGVLVGLLSFLTYRFVETPALALKHRRSTRLARTVPAPSTTT